MFSFTHYSGLYGRVDITDNTAAGILKVTKKTIKKYSDNPDKADPIKMAYLEATACGRILPNNWDLWVKNDRLHTSSGYSFNKAELDAVGWLRETFDSNCRRVDELSNRVKEL